MSLIDTVPVNLQGNIGIFSFGNITGVTDPVFQHITSVVGFEYTSSPLLNSMSFPNLLTVDPTNLQIGGIFLSGNVNFTTFSAPLLRLVGGDCTCLSDSTGWTGASLPSLTKVGRDFVFGGLHFNYSNLTTPVLASVGQLELSGLGVFSIPSLTNIGGAPGNGTVISSGNFTGTTFSLPNVVTILGNFIMNAPNLTTVDLSAWVPTNGTTISFFGSNSLNATSVNMVLRRCAANAAYVSGTINLPGAAPTGQGITDKATLIGRGVSVTTN